MSEVVSSRRVVQTNDCVLQVRGICCQIRSGRAWATLVVCCELCETHLAACSKWRKPLMPPIDIQREKCRCLCGDRHLWTWQEEQHDSLMASRPRVLHGHHHDGNLTQGHGGEPCYMLQVVSNCYIKHIYMRICRNHSDSVDTGCHASSKGCSQRSHLGPTP